MWRQSFKLTGQMLGVVAVLVVALALPGATQSNAPLTREGVVGAVNETLEFTLTASSKGDILNPEAATHLSTKEATLTYVPLKRESTSSQRLLEEAYSGRSFEPISLGVLVVDQHPSFPKGTFEIRLTSEGTLQFVDDQGEVTFKAQGQIVKPEQEVDLKSQPWRPTFETSFSRMQMASSSASESKVNQVCARTNTAGCRTKTVCDSFSIIGITIWRSCQEIIICDD